MVYLLFKYILIFYNFTEAINTKYGYIQIYPATEKVFVEYFPDKKEYIRAYIKEYNTNFNSVESVRDLFMAMNGE